jgi:hypothetical protein
MEGQISNGAQNSFVCKFDVCEKLPYTDSGSCVLHFVVCGVVYMPFKIISEITNIEVIAIGDAIRDIARLKKSYGLGRWRKLKGIAMVRLSSGRIRRAELHWYEAHGIGKKEIKRKRYLD